MTNIYAPAKALTYLLLFAFFFCSCSTDSKKNTNLTGSANSDFYLSSLTVADGVFKANRNKNIVFSYYIGDTTVLRGWVLKKGFAGSSGTYNTTPDLILNSTGKSAIKIEPKTLLSNQVILSSRVKDIVDAIGNKDAILYFDPAKDPETGNIFYKITFRYKGQSIDSLASETFTTNPAPPRQAYD